jgi:uncharacterized membrane protein
MKRTKTIAGIIMSAILILGGITHFTHPEVSSGLIPDFLPKNLVHYFIGVFEILLGVGVWLKGYRQKALMGITILMLLFLPLHVIDLFRAEPVLGSTTAATIRLFIQFILIFLPWYARK